MAVYGNFKGTTQPGFTVGKTGAASIYGNPSSPPSSPTSGDVWMDSANTALKIYDGTEWSQGNFVGNLEGFIEIEVIAGENLVKGDVVYVSGSSGNTPEVSKAQANSTSTMPAVGICEQTINSGNSGFIVVQGLLTGIDTSTYSEGDVLYVSSTVAGAFTSSAPTGESNRIQNVGKVINAAGGGSILVTGAGRFNATPALNNGNIFIGNTNNEAVTVGLDVFLTASGYLKNVVEDTTPELGGNLDVNGQLITSSSNGNIAITPNGSGYVKLDGLNWPQADGTANQYLQTDGSGNLSFADGPIGYTGSIGFTGSKGDQGNTGYNGSQGIQGNVGFTGSQGASAIGGSFVYTQSSAASTWTITHNLNSQYLNVEVIDDTGNSLVGTSNYPVVNFTNANVTTLTFSTSISGYAALTSGGGVAGSQGNVGFTGSQGDQGVIGFTGSAGFTGSKGDQGTIGFTGSAGVQGGTGFTGSAGSQGLIGFTGSRGDQGVIGFTGSQGNTGFTGSQGDQGVIGYTGSKGDQGDAGFTGSAGSQGLIGFTGSKGEKGNVGFTGSQGDQGVIGFTGSKGDIGFTGSQGDIGFTGSLGFTGSQGGFGGATFEYEWSTDTAVSDPGAGNVKINNANLTSGTILSIDDIDAQGTDIQQFLRTIDDSTSAIKGHFRMANKLNADDFVMYTISAISEETGYFQVTVSYVDGSATSFTNGEELIMTFARTGDKGDTGFTGSKGDVGFTGSKGFTGSQGDQGVIGFTGSQGDQGTTGFTGSQGNQGLIGFTGSKGDTGNVGFTGSQGTQGVIGFTGSRGATGFTGSKGDQGITGFTGSEGAQGLIGFTGSQGDQGVIGFTGSQGIQGVIGYTGSQGDQGVIGFTGSKGNQGVIGFTGSKGDQGVIGFTGSQGIQGVIGFTGSRGVQGVRGYTGSKGDTGFNGSAGAENATLDSVTDNGSTTTNSITVGSLQTTTLTTGSNATAGTVTGDWTLTAGSTWSATYADLAEKYTTDKEYEPGTVMKFGGTAELTQSDTANDHRVAGVVSTNPAYILNAEIEGQYLALSGRVPVKVTGSVSPGDILVTSNVPGHAQVNNIAESGRIIGKAITSDANGVCEALVTLM